jgi:hypothetical protein
MVRDELRSAGTTLYESQHKRLDDAAIAYRGVYGDGLPKKSTLLHEAVVPLGLVADEWLREKDWHENMTRPQEREAWLRGVLAFAEREGYFDDE